MTEKLNDLLPTTPDVQAERLSELKRLFPDLFDGEGQLKLDEVKQLTGDEPQYNERYDFSWYGKRKAKETAYTPTTATLSYDESRSVNPDKAEGNLIIEGENLESLKTLLSAYRESIKCIYIDPPYNTGKDFVYSDNYSENKHAYWEETGGLEKGVKVDTNPETAGRYHSNWLSMMYSRLLLARQLLKDDGVIFVSIDDNEVHNLRRLMDDVFGEENFVASVIWQGGRKNDSKRFSVVHDYMLVFAKDDGLLKESEIIWRERKTGLDEVYKKAELLLKEENYNYDDASKALGSWFKLLPDGNIAKEHSHYKKIDKNGIYYGDNISSPNYRKNLIFNWKGYTPPSNGWRYSKETMERLDKEGLLLYPDSKDKRIQYKRYLHQTEEWAPSTWLYRDRRAASKRLNKLMGTAIFDFPKDEAVIGRFINIFTKESDLILDFFGGSGSTAQAILEQNKKDNGNRKFILVQLPEQTPEKSEAKKAGYDKISDITVERVKRIIQGYGDTPEPLDTGFKVYQLTKSHFPRTEFKPTPEKSEEENIAALKEYITEKEKQLTGLFEATEIQDEVLLKNGFKLNYQLSNASEFKGNKVRLADDGEKQSLLCLDSKLNPETVKQLIKNPQAFICLERALSTDDKWNLRQHLKHEFVAF